MTKDDATVWYTNGYQPYGQDNGNPNCPSCPTSPPIKFTGKPFSATTGLYYYFHRWYDPSIGRFISVDPKHGHLSNPQSLNLYIYVVDLPTTLKDPSGLDWWNPWSWTPQQQAQAFTIAVIVISVVAVVASGGLAAPVAAMVVGAAVGASTSTAVYTITAGSKANLAGAVGAAVTGAVAGAIGGGAGAAGGLVGSVVGNAIGSVAGDVLGNVAQNLVAGNGLRLTNISAQSLLLDASIGAIAGGAGKGVGGEAETFVSEDVASSVGRPTNRISLLVGSLINPDDHPRATYQEVSGLMKAGFDAGIGFDAGLITNYLNGIISPPS
jgi:RHS repeat-associated protein